MALCTWCIIILSMMLSVLFRDSSAPKYPSGFVNRDGCVVGVITGLEKTAQCDQFYVWEILDINKNLKQALAMSVSVFGSKFFNSWYINPFYFLMSCRASEFLLQTILVGGCVPKNAGSGALGPCLNT